MTEWQGVPDDYMDHFGFVYLIKHRETGCSYIGKKQFKKRLRRKPLKGKKRHRIDWVESDWKTYWGSSENLLEAVAREGEESFDRFVMRVCDSKFEMAYEELIAQIANNVLNDPKSFNGIINVRLSKPVGDPIKKARETNEE